METLRSGCTNLS